MAQIRPTRPPLRPAWRTVSPAGEASLARLVAVPDAPSLLYVRGDLGAPSGPVVAIVGSRAATGHGQALARTIASGLASRGALIVSGGAVGIDTAAHRGALEAGGATWSVVVTDNYPWQSRPLYDHVSAVLTPFEPGGRVSRWQFPRRNRVIAALADVVIVVEASASSGAHHTAIAAREYGRILAACPGTPGTEALLAQGAAVVETAADVLAALEGAPRALPPPVLPDAGSDERAALDSLSPVAPLGSRDVALRSGLDERRAACALLSLEIDGLALPLPGGHYVRSALADRGVQS